MFTVQTDLITVLCAYKHILITPAYVSEIESGQLYIHTLQLLRLWQIYWSCTPWRHSTMTSSAGRCSSSPFCYITTGGIKNSHCDKRARPEHFHLNLWIKGINIMMSSKWKHFPRYWPFVRRIHRSPPVTRSFGDFFNLRLYKRFGKQSGRRWLETPSLSLLRHCDEQQWNPIFCLRVGGVVRFLVVGNIGKWPHGFSSGCSSIWLDSNSGLSSAQHEQIPVVFGVWPFRTTLFFSFNNILVGLGLNCNSSVEITFLWLTNYFSTGLCFCVRV